MGNHRIETYDYRMIQTGPRSYITEQFEFQRWWLRDTTELLDTYPKTVEEAMQEDWDAVVNPPRLGGSELGELFRQEFKEEYPPPIDSKEGLLSVFEGLRGRTSES